MNLKEQLTELPAEERVYFGLSQVSGFVAIDQQEAMIEQLPTMNDDWYKAEVDYAAVQKRIVDEAPDQLDELRKKIDKLEKELERAKRSKNALEERFTLAKKNLAIANEIIDQWEPLEEREVLESYARDVFGVGTVVITPGNLIGPPKHNYWTYEEAHGECTVEEEQ